MIFLNKFYVEGGVYGSKVSLYYGHIRLKSIYFIEGDRKSYNRCRRDLYRYRDRIMLYVGNLEHLGFTVSVSE